MKAIRLCASAFFAVLSQVRAGTIAVDPTSGETGLVSGYGGMTLGWEF